MKSPVLFEKEAAEYIKMSVSYLRNDRCYGARGNSTPGPRYVKQGRAVRYRIEALDQWLRDNEKSGPDSV